MLYYPHAPITHCSSQFSQHAKKAVTIFSTFTARVISGLWHEDRHPNDTVIAKGMEPPAQHNHLFEVFCSRVLAWSKASKLTVYLSLKYIHRLKIYRPEIQGAQGSEYRMFVVALLVAQKMLEDKSFNNKTWSVITGLRAQEISIMEREFFQCLKWDIHVCHIEFESWRASLERQYDYFHAYMSELESHHNVSVIPYSISPPSYKYQATYSPLPHVTHPHPYQLSPSKRRRFSSIY